MLVNPPGYLKATRDSKTGRSVINNGSTVHVFIISLVQHLELTSPPSSQAVGQQQLMNQFISSSSQAQICPDALF